MFIAMQRKYLQRMLQLSKVRTLNIQLSTFQVLHYLHIRQQHLGADLEQSRHLKVQKQKQRNAKSLLYHMQMVNLILLAQLKE